MNIKAHIKNNKAFTLIELMMGVLIVSIIGAIIAGSYVAGSTIKTKQEDLLTVEQNLRVAMYLITRELKMAAFDLTPTWSMAVNRNLNVITNPAGGQSSITFQYRVDGPTIDVNWDGISDDGDLVTVTYNLNATGQLNRTVLMPNGITSPPMTIADNISSITFSYFNDDGLGQGNRAWSTTPATNAPAFTFATGISIVAQNNQINPKIPSQRHQFRDPYTGTIYQTPDDQFERRMSSSVVCLRNMIF